MSDALRKAVEALEDLLGGWTYIRSFHGDLYGVGWDRAQNKGEAALTAAREHLAREEARSPLFDTAIYVELRTADARGISPPQNWTTRAADELERLYRALHAAAQPAPVSAPAVPQGWRLVPVEPTPEMVEAYRAANAAYWYAVDALPSKPRTKWLRGTSRDATTHGYRAMLSVAPPPPEPAAQPEAPEPVAPAVEQALYSLEATADDLRDEGLRDRAALLRACATTLRGAIHRTVMSCNTHGRPRPGAWGCPECVREMRVSLRACRGDDCPELGSLKDSYGQQLAENGGLRAEVERLRAIGAQLANVAFNWAQKPGHTLTGHDVALLDKLRREWDAARHPHPAPPGVPHE